MGSDHSFDVVCEIDAQEVTNALEQAKRETTQRYDLKDAKASLDYDSQKHQVILKAQDEYKVRAILDIFKQKLIKRDISIKALKVSDPERIGGDFSKIEIGIQQGIEQEFSKKIVKAIKEAKLKVQAQIQGDQLRVTSKKIDELQACMKEIKNQDFPIHLSFKNLR
ncbi:MAG: YajQ family cyclic di-GMP-binding protein [bacterium]